MLDPDAELERGIESGMSFDVEMAHVTLSTVIDCITSIIPEFSEDSNSTDDTEDKGLEVCKTGLNIAS